MVDINNVVDFLGSKLGTANVLDMDKILSTITSKGGLQYTNKFVMFIPHPTSLGNESNSNELANIFNRLQYRPHDVTILGRSARLPGKQIATSDLLIGPKSKKVPYAQLTDDFTCSFIVTKDMFVWDYFNKWQDVIVDNNSYHVSFKEDISSDVIIQTVSDDKITPTKSIKLVNAFPVTLDAIELDQGNESQWAILNITMAYDKWEVAENVSSFAGSLDIVSNLDGLGDIGNLVGRANSAFDKFNVGKDVITKFKNNF